MINLEFRDADGNQLGMAYDVHPRSQDEPVAVPEGTATVIVWLGTT